jgi:hypothetical protein
MGRQNQRRDLLKRGTLQKKRGESQHVVIAATRGDSTGGDWNLLPRLAERMRIKSFSIDIEKKSGGEGSTN